MSTGQPRRPASRPVRRRPAAAPSSRFVFPAVLALVVVAGIAAVIVAASGGNDSSKADHGRKEVAPHVEVTGSVLPEYTATGSDPAVGLAAPTLTSVNFDDEPVTAGGATGKPYALVFLAHWCPHCQAEVPRIVRLAQQGTTNGVDVVGIPTGTDPNAPNYPPSAWLRREAWPFPVLLDTRSQTAARAYGLSAYPYFVFVDANGKVAGRVTGEVDPEKLADAFRALAAGRALPSLTSGSASTR